jgi:hypothetical protein
MNPVLGQILAPLLKNKKNFDMKILKANQPTPYV